MYESKQGFTLIELVIVIVVIGVLAAIATPIMRNSKDRGYVATMKSDLRNLATAQEDYLLNNDTYFSGSVPDTALMHAPSQGVTLVLQDVSDFGWAATATHANSPRTCTIYLGGAPPLAPATSEGIPNCQ